MVVFHLIMFLALSFKFWYVLFHVCSHFDGIDFLTGSHSSAVDDENFPGWFVIPKNDLELFLLGGAFLLVHGPFLGQVVLLLWISSPQRMVL